MVVDCICIAGSRLTREHEHEHRYKRAEASKGTGRAPSLLPRSSPVHLHPYPVSKDPCFLRPSFFASANMTIS
jgi:hypothetical protein